MGNVDLVRATMGDNEQAAAFLDVITESANRARNLCPEILDYAGKGRFEIRSVDLNEVLSVSSRLT